MPATVILLQVGVIVCRYELHLLSWPLKGMTTLIRMLQAFMYLHVRKYVSCSVHNVLFVSVQQSIRVCCAATHAHLEKSI